MTTYQLAIEVQGELTTGIIITDEIIQLSHIVTVALHNENGMPMEATGPVVDILSEDVR